jgi:hypothetical protein
MDKTSFYPCKVVFSNALELFHTMGLFNALEHSFVFFFELLQCSFFFFVDFPKVNMFLCVALLWVVFVTISISKIILDRSFYYTFCLMIPTLKTLIILITFIWVLNISVWRCLLLMLYLAWIFMLFYVVGELHKVLIFICWLMSTLKMLRVGCLNYLHVFLNDIMNGCEHTQLFSLRKLLNAIFIASH